MDNLVNSLVTKTIGLTDRQVIDNLLANPNRNDSQIVQFMANNGVSPEQMAGIAQIPVGQLVNRIAATVSPGQSVTLGDTIVQPQYQTTGSGQDQQIGGLENVLTYKAGENKVGGSYNQYNPDGTLQRTGTQQEVNANKDFLKFALGAGALFGGAALAGLGEAGAAGSAAGATGGSTLGSLGALGTEGAVAGMGAGTGLTAGSTGTGLTAGASGLGLNAGGALGTGAGLGANALGSGITAGSGLTGTGVLAGSG